MAELSKKSMDKWADIYNSIEHFEEHIGRDSRTYNAMQDIRCQKDLTREEIDERLDQIRSRFHEVVSKKQMITQGALEPSLNVLPCICGLYPELSVTEKRAGVVYNFNCNEFRHYMNCSASGDLKAAVYWWNAEVLKYST